MRLGLDGNHLSGSTLRLNRNDLRLGLHLHRNELSLRRLRLDHHLLRRRLHGCQLGLRRLGLYGELGSLTQTGRSQSKVKSSVQGSVGVRLRF